MDILGQLKRQSLWSLYVYGEKYYNHYIAPLEHKIRSYIFSREICLDNIAAINRGMVYQPVNQSINIHFNSAMWSEQISLAYSKLYNAICTVTWPMTLNDPKGQVASGS